MTTVFDKAAKIRSDYQREVGRIRGDKTLSASGRATKLAEVWRTAETKLRTLQNEYRQGLESEHERLRSEAFSMRVDPALSEAEKTVVRASHRDVLDRASRLSSPREAATLLEGAKRSNDRYLAQAIAGKAFEAGWVDTLNQHLELFPAQGKKFEALWDFERAQSSVDTKLATSAGLSIPPQPADAHITGRTAAAGGDGA